MAVLPVFFVHLPSNNTDSMNLSKNTTAHISIIAANILFGLNYSYSKSVINGGISPLALSEMRIVVAAVLFILITRLIGNSLKVDKEDRWKLVIGGILGVVGNQLLFLKGLEFTSPVDASIITTSSPLLVLIISAIFLRERITAIKLIGIGIGAVGALMVIVNGAITDMGENQWFGNIMIMFCAISYAAYLVWIKPMMKKYSAMTVMAWIFSVAAIISTPICISEVIDTQWSAISFDTYGALIFVLLGATFGAYFFIAYGLKSINPTTVSMYNYSQPIIAATFAIIRGQDTLSMVKIFATVLVFLGVFMVIQSYRFENKRTKI